MTRSVLVTGASSGFGRNAVLDLAADGWRVFASMRDIGMGRALMAEAGDAVTLLPLDVTDDKSIQSAVALAEADIGGALDAVLNNAGYAAIGAFEDLPDAECRRQMETNFFGTLAVTRAVLPAMRRAGRGRIVVVTSNAVNTPHPMLTMYAASKWALEGWAEGLAMEVAPFGIEVVVVQPGAHRTPFATNIVPILPEGSAYMRWIAAVAPGIANLDRWGRNADCARGPIMASIGDIAPPFRTAIGEDAVFFAGLKGAMPFEARALALRALVGAPAPGAFRETTVMASDVGTRAEIAAQLATAMAEDPSLLAEAVALAATSPTALR